MRTIPFIFALALAGCATTATIADLEEDKVIVQGTGGDLSVIDAEANRGCAMHGRVAQRISYTCLDGYCIRKSYLYACIAE